VKGSTNETLRILLVSLCFGDVNVSGYVSLQLVAAGLSTHVSSLEPAADEPNAVTSSLHMCHASSSCHHGVPISVLSDAEWVTIPFLLDSSRHQQREDSVRHRGLVLEVGEEAFWLPGFKPCRQVWSWLGSLESKPRIVQRICSSDVLRGRSSPMNKQSRTTDMGKEFFALSQSLSIPRLEVATNVHSNHCCKEGLCAPDLRLYSSMTLSSLRLPAWFIAANWSATGSSRRPGTSPSLV
jgi:hypothetical protein